MSVLERFFQIAAVITVITIGMNISIDVFGEPMTGQPALVMPDVNASTGLPNYPNSITQSSTAPQDLPTSILSQSIDFLIDGYVQLIGSNILSGLFGIQKILYSLLSPYDGLEIIAVQIGVLLTAIQTVGGLYLLVSGITILRGSGGTP